MPYYGAASYDSGARYDTPPAATPTRRMPKLKLELQLKSDEDLRGFANAHIAAMSGNANFATPTPTAAVFDPKAAAFGAKLDEITALESDIAARRAERDALRTDLEAALTARGAYVEMTAAGDAAKILTAGFQLKADPSPTSSLPQPGNLIATMGDNAGEIDLACDAVKKAKSYIWECSEHPDNAAPTPWVQAKISARSSITVTGLTSGKKYAFRVRAIGPNEVLSPWSDEAICMSP